MTTRALAAVVPFVLLAGCADGQRVRLAGPSPEASPRLPRHVSAAPATEETARRVLQIGRRVVDANPQTGLRPVFLTIGAPHAELFHQGGGVEPLRVYITEGLVRRCKDDAELAALLCHELGRVVADRAALPAKARDAEPSAAGVGNDAAGPFGPPDGTRLLEEGQRERQRRAARPATPLTLARGYLARAGYPAQTLGAVAPLLREAEQNFVVEKHIRPEEPPTPPPAAEPIAVWRSGQLR